MELDEESKPLTTFTVGPLGFYECERMPFGATNAPATFQQMMETCLGDLHLNWCLIYLDDIIVFAKTQQEAITRLGTMFQKLREARLKLQPSKCELLKTSLLYLGHIVSEDGIRKTLKSLSCPSMAHASDHDRYQIFFRAYQLLQKILRGICQDSEASKQFDQ